MVRITFLFAFYNSVFCKLLFIHREKVFYGFVCRALISFQRKNIICFFFLNFLADFFLAAHCIDRDYHSFYINQFQKLRNCSDFIWLFICLYLPKNEGQFICPCTYNVNSLCSRDLVWAAHRLSVDGNNCSVRFNFYFFVNSMSPLYKNFLDFICVHISENPENCVGTWRTELKLHQPLDGLFCFLRPFSYVFNVLDAA